MLFQTDEERTKFLREIETGQSTINPGDSIKHVVSVKGLWVDENAIRADFAILLSHEIYSKRLIYILPEKISTTKAFNEAFQISRKPARADTHNTVRSLGTNRSHMTVMNGDLTDEEIKKLKNVCDDIYLELIRHAQDRFNAVQVGVKEKQ